MAELSSAPADQAQDDIRPEVATATLWTTGMGGRAWAALVGMDERRHGAISS